MTTHADHPTDTVSELLAKARACLAEGDLMQASANGWRAAEQMVEAVAEKRGWDHCRPRRPFSRRRPSGGGVALANGCRISSARPKASTKTAYGDDMPTAMVADGIDDVERFAAALESHLS